MSDNIINILILIELCRNPGGMIKQGVRINADEFSKGMP